MGGCAVRGPTHVRPVIERTRIDLSPESIEEKNLESYYLFWLDSTVRSPEFIETHNELRSIINHVKIFESNIQCLIEFEKILNGKIFLIINCTESLSLLPKLHNHRYLHSIYIYHNGDNIDMEQAKIQYRKVFNFDYF